MVVGFDEVRDDLIKITMLHPQFFQPTLQILLFQAASNP